MAVTITVDALAAAMRVGTTAEETEEVTRLRTYAIDAIEHHLGTAYGTTPDSVVNEATVRLASYLYDQPTVSGRDGFANAMRNSGAGRMLLPYVVHRLGTTAEATAAAQAAVGSADNPVTGLAVSGTTLRVTFADGSTVDETLPVGGGPVVVPGGDGTDQTARDAAAAAQATANANTAAIAALDIPTLPMPATPGEAEGGTSTTIRGWTSALIRRAINAVVPAWARAGDATPIPAPKLVNAADAHEDIVNVIGGRLPGPPVAMRLGWSQSRNFVALDFNRPSPPIGGSVAGTSQGLAAPPFPPALDTDPTLYLGIWLAGEPNIAELPAGFAVADARPLVVDGAQGRYYPSAARLPASVVGTVYRIVIRGPRILTENDLVTSGGGGLAITNLGSYTTTAQAMSGDVQDTGIASPATGLFLIVTIGGEEDVLWFNRRFVHERSGVPQAGGAANDSVYLSSIRAMRMGKTAGGNFALTNAFTGTLIQAGTVITFAVIG